MMTDFLAATSDFFVTTPDFLVTNTELPCDKAIADQTCGAGDATTFAVLPAPRALSKVSMSIMSTKHHSRTAKGIMFNSFIIYYYYYIILYLLLKA